jgi:hypothetical protein
MPVPVKSTIRTDYSRPVIPVKLAIPVPFLRTIRIDTSRSILPVRQPIAVSYDVPAVLELATCVKQRLNKPV